MAAARERASCTHVVVAQHFEGRQRGALASGVATSGSGGGTIILGAVVGVALRAVGWRATLLILAAATAVGVGVASIALAEPRGFRARAAAARLGAASAPAVGPLVRRHCCVVAVYAFGWEVPFVHLVALARDEGLSGAVQNAVVVAIGIGGLLGRCDTAAQGIFARTPRLANLSHIISRKSRSARHTQREDASRCFSRVDSSVARAHRRDARDRGLRWRAPPA